MTTTTRRRLDPALRRAQIIDAAERVFLDRDPAEVTFEEVAEAAGVSRALVYNYFGDRGGLLAAVYLRSFGRLDAQLDAALTADLPPADRLRAVIRCYLDFAVTDAAAWKLVGAAEASLHPVVQTTRRRRDDQLAEAWGGDGSARIAARAVGGMLEATTLDWLDHREGSVDEVAEVLFTILWHGVSHLGTPSGASATAP